MKEHTVLPVVKLVKVAFSNQKISFDDLVNYFLSVCNRCDKRIHILKTVG